MNESYTQTVAYATAVEAVLAAVRSVVEQTPRQEVLVVQALALAAQFDHEAEEGHTIRLTTASTELRQVLAEFFGAEVARDDGDDWDADAELARLTRTPPTLGDAS